MSKNKRVLIRLLICAVLLVFGIIADSFALGGTLRFLPLVLYIGAWLIAGYDVLIEAVMGLIHGQLLDENFLMAVATVGAIFLKEYPEAVAVMAFYQLGEAFQRYAVGKTRRSVQALASLCPDTANLLVGGEIKEVFPEDVNVGDLIIIRAGERVPLDGVIENGESTLDMSALTGESLPVNVKTGDSVISGSINIDGVITLRVTKIFAESTVSKILELVESSAEKKAPAENFITKFARVYTPCVVSLAVLLCVVPSLISGNFPFWLRKSLMLLMVSCPCALVVSVPLGFFGGIGAAAKKGILIKGSGFMEVLSRTIVAVFDKTGTLTKGEFTVTDVIPAEGIDKEFLLSVAVAAEENSSHPLALGIVKLRQSINKNIPKATDVRELSGRGVECVFEGKKVLAGNRLFFKENGVKLPFDNEKGGVLFACDGQYIGSIYLADTVKNDSADALSRLKKMGVKKTVILTGDGTVAAENVAKEVNADEVFARLLPADKVTAVEKLIAENKNGKLLFVGDGINDAPVLARADVGIAMGGIGSDAAIEAADVVIMDDKLSRIADAVAISRKTLSIVKQNIAFSLVVKLSVLLLAAILPNMSMTLAIFADVGVMVLAVVNSLRALKG